MRAPFVRVETFGVDCTCQRCGHAWRVHAKPGATGYPDPPTHCAACKAPRWDVRAGVLKTGRPRKDADA